MKINVCEPYLIGNEKKYVADALDSNWISSNGKYIEQFEQKFSDFCSVKHGVSCSNGTAALQIALQALGIKKGDEVIMPTFSIISCANAIISTGARPVLVDSDPETYNIDANKIEQKITPNTKAIMPVHTYGHPCDMDKITELAKKYDLKIVEDSAEAQGAEYKGKKTGSLSDVACFSFYANKIITTGEGGMCVTNSKELAEKLKYYRNLAFTNPRYVHEDLAYNFRFTNIHAAIGLAQTENADKLVSARRSVGLRYNKALKEIPGLILPVEKQYGKNVYWMYGVLLADSIKLTKQQVMSKLAEKGISTRSFFISMHKQPVFTNKKLENSPDCAGEYPVADKISERGFYLPSSSNLSDQEIEYISNSLKEILSNNNL